MTKKMNSLSAGVIGALVGAAAVGLAHKPTRKKVKAKVTSMLENADSKMDELDKKASQKIKEVKRKTKNKIAESMDDAEDKLSTKNR